MFKVKFIALVSCFIASGCIGSADYYASKTAYYQAQASASQAYIQAASKPLAEMKAPDGTVFVVNNTAIQAPVIQQAGSPIVDGLKVILNSTPAAVLSGGWAAKEIIKNSAGTFTNNGDGGTISNNSGNTPSYINGDTDNSTSTVDDHTATAPPLVVTQPDPVIVNQPEPIVIEQPEPIVIEQPEPIIIQPME